MQSFLILAYKSGIGRGIRAKKECFASSQGEGKRSGSKTANGSFSRSVLPPRVSSFQHLRAARPLLSVFFLLLCQFYSPQTPQTELQTIYVHLHHKSSHSFPEAAVPLKFWKVTPHKNPDNTFSIIRKLIHKCSLIPLVSSKVVTSTSGIWYSKQKQSELVFFPSNKWAITLPAQLIEQLRTSRVQSQETQTGWLVNTAGYSECSAFPFGKAVSAPSCACRLQRGSPKIFYPTYKSCHIPGYFIGESFSEISLEIQMSEIHSLRFAEKQTHVEDEGGMRRLKQSVQRGKGTPSTLQKNLRQTI